MCKCLTPSREKAGENSNVQEQINRLAKLESRTVYNLKQNEMAGEVKTENGTQVSGWVGIESRDIWWQNGALAGG